MSEKTIHEMLFEIQRDLPVLPKSKEGYGYNYTPLDIFMQALRPLLDQHELSLIHACKSSTEGKLTLETKLVHGISNQSVSVDVPLYSQGSKNPMQELGASITYARRYALGMLFAVVCDEDTDGTIERRFNAANEKAGPRITSAQVDDLEKILGADANKRESFLSVLRDRRGWPDLTNIPASKYDGVLKHAKEWMA